MGTELRDPYYYLNDKNTKVLKSGMVFNLSLMIPMDTYALAIADTVLIKGDNESGEVLTELCKKGWDDITYFNVLYTF